MNDNTELIKVRQGKHWIQVSQGEAVKRAELYVAKNLPKYLKKLEELAAGVLVIKKDRKGKESLYLQPPDRAALEYLIDRGMGKAPQRFEIEASSEDRAIQAWAPAEVIEGESKVIEEEKEVEE